MPVSRYGRSKLDDTDGDLYLPPPVLPSLRPPEILDLSVPLPKR